MSGQYRLEWDQLEWDRHSPEDDPRRVWVHRVEVFDSFAAARAFRAGLLAYVDQQGENYPGQAWVRDVGPILRRGFTEWTETEKRSILT